MTVGIVGLGLIGGSFAKAYHEQGHRVLAWDTDASVLSFAQMFGAVDGTLDETALASCDLLLIAVYPRAAVAYLRENAEKIRPETVVIDCCGTKRRVCEACFQIAKAHGLCYLGGHPMAGKHQSGFKYASGSLFHGAPMVLVPENADDIVLLARVKELLAPAGFAKISVTTAEKHDAMIAFTSQMAHVVSNAYIKSETAREHKGFSAGSYKDMTRVAWLNPEMWAELFLENKDFLMCEMDTFIENLQQYRDAMARDDKETLIRLLDEGRRRKEEVDG